MLKFKGGESRRRVPSPTIPDEHLPRPLFVVVTKNGAELPLLSDRAAFPLLAPALQYLGQLAGAAGHEGDLGESDDDHIAALRVELAERGLLESGSPPPGITRDTTVGSDSDKDEADPEPDAELALSRPLVFRLGTGGFEYVGHSGDALCSLTARQLLAAMSYLSARTPGDAFGHQQSVLSSEALDRGDHGRLIGHLRTIGILQSAALATAIEDRATVAMREALRNIGQRRAAVTKHLEQCAAAEARRVAQTGHTRTRVIPVNKEDSPLLSLGLVMSYALAYDGGRLAEAYEFVPDWCHITTETLTGDEPPAIFLFSSYIWSHTWNLAASEEAKRRNPNGLCIHGGPDVPKYDEDLREYLGANPHIDVIVHGEGEATLAEILDRLDGALGDGPCDLTVLDDVAGLTHRRGDHITHTGPRERIADLDDIPSPYANGLFDSIGEAPLVLQTVETNRGCPYGCAFCDWGSATKSRIRKFDYQRVLDDLEWCAKNQTDVVLLTDSNFGIFKRDVDIARHVVALREEYGYPKVFESSYAKNTVKHLSEIVQILADGNVISAGTLSLQSVDPGTLEAIRRSNIKIEKYDQLATEFGTTRLPLVVELMMGLPGSTLESFRGDIQQCIDREVQARLNATEVLVNSPMNEPDYRTEWAIDLSRPIASAWDSNKSGEPIEKALILSTSSFTRAEYDQMARWRLLFLLMENFGVLRHVARYVRHDTGVAEIDFYDRLDAAVTDDPHRFPTLSLTLESIPEYMVPPGTWTDFMAEVRDYLVNDLGVQDDPALDTVLRVQLALLPSRDRTFPDTVELAHDYPAWHTAMLEAKRAGWEQDWTPGVPPLSSLGPTTFAIDDPQQLSTAGMGIPIEVDTDMDWEFASPVSRALRFRRTRD